MGSRWHFDKSPIAINGTVSVVVWCAIHGAGVIVDAQIVDGLADNIKITRQNRRLFGLRQGCQQVRVGALEQGSQVPGKKPVIGGPGCQLVSCTVAGWIAG